ncbi:hypothetical protein ACM7LV_10835 [Pseudomonas aeruginosa]|uniref:hypothetical protein n=1 Tax=Stutzerimonas stutzeri TaxID=316 RepID=UPI000D2259B1|nr:hypothetical protein [Stutzerimonas stutzeri]AVX11485.1 hypothetical protein CXB48_01270 [Stutzerimonas stutzeri]RRW29402.1 hypothetical protein EGJ47_06635 [Stutzerimonas stutzeri]
MKIQGGWTGIGVLAVVLSAAMGALLAHYIVSSFDRTTAPVVQWGLLTVFLLPMGFAIQLWVNLNSMRETKWLSGSERTVSEKIREVQIALSFYLVSPVIIAFGLWFSPASWKVYHAVTVYTGLSLGISISSFFLILHEWREISNFKSRVFERSARNKQLAKKLDALNPKSD